MKDSISSGFCMCMHGHKHHVGIQHQQETETEKHRQIITSQVPTSEYQLYVGRVASHSSKSVIKGLENEHACDVQGLPSVLPFKCLVGGGL